ncbi:MAG: AMP-binding protein, partial [Actinomycetota bacterium]
MEADPVCHHPPMKELVYPRLLLPAVENFASKEAFFDGDYRGTFEQHGDRVARLCAALSSELGITKGDRFAVMATNSHQYLELYHAAFMGAGIINPLNLRLAGKELDYIIRDSGSEVIFVDAFFAPVIAQAMAESDGDNPIRKTVLIGDAADAPYDITYEELIAGVEPAFPDEPEEDDPVILMYTGGTTGLPKGVLLEQRAELLNLYHVATVVDLDPDAVYLHQTPMFHAASMGGILGSPAVGSGSAFIPLFDPAGVLELVSALGVTQTMMVPTMIGLTLTSDGFEPEKLASLQQLTYGASPMPPALLEKLLALYPDLEVSQGYGMTESSACLTFLTAADHAKGGPRLQSAGKAVLGVTLSIRDEEGNEVPRGESGEVWARGGNFMREYWNKPEATAEVFADGWYH